MGFGSASPFAAVRRDSAADSVIDAG